MDDGECRRAGRDHARDHRARLELELCAPVLHALGQGVVRPLRHAQAVDELDLLAVAARHGRVEVLDEPAAAAQRVRQQLDPHRAEPRAVVGARRGVGGVGTHVDVGGRAEEGHAAAGARLAQPLDDVVGTERELDV
eukprot:scaffold29034_cov52-Phaeocystis_antarctica.AAC.1